VSATNTLAIAILVATGLIQIWHLAISGVVQSIVFSFNMPARQSMVPTIVSKERLANAVALTSIGGNFSRIIGPSVAGILMGMAAVGVKGTYFVIAALIFMVSVLSFFLPTAKAASDAKREPLIQSIATGFRFLRSSPLLFLMFWIGFIPITLGMPSQMLLPVFNELVLAQTVEILGLSYAAMGVGALVGSLFIASRARQGDTVRQQLTFGGLFGVTIVLFSFTRDYRAALAMLFLMGIASQCYMTVNMTFLMTNTPPEYMGRVMSMQMLTMAAMPLGAFPLSALADTIGIAYTFTISGAIIAVAMFAVALLRPRGQVERKIPSP
jgi:MFS family permease